MKYKENRKEKKRKRLNKIHKKQSNEGKKLNSFYFEAYFYSLKLMSKCKCFRIHNLHFKRALAQPQTTHNIGLNQQQRSLAKEGVSACLK
jgi:hypothetical protein